MSKKPLILDFPSSSLTQRPVSNGYSFGPGDYVEGGALNANYRDVEAACIISNALGEAGYKYNEDFFFLTCGLDKVQIIFKNEEAATYAAMKLKFFPKDGLEV
jgi:hypothetical protein